MSDNTNTEIFTGSLDDVAWIRINGVATKDTSAPIRPYLAKTYAEGIRNFVFDLKHCRLIDSTFIGILSSLAGRISEAGSVNLIHTNPRNATSICKLGLDNMIRIDRDDEKFKDLELRVSTCLDRLADVNLNKSEKASMILEAHEDICSINEDLEEEFRDVLDFLRRNQIASIDSDETDSDSTEEDKDEDEDEDEE